MKKLSKLGLALVFISNIAQTTLANLCICQSEGSSHYCSVWTASNDSNYCKTKCNFHGIQMNVVGFNKDSTPVKRCADHWKCSTISDCSKYWPGYSCNSALSTGTCYKK